MTTDLDTRDVVQRETPPPHTDGWTTLRDVTDDCDALRATLDRLVDPHAGVAVNPQTEDIERAQDLIAAICGAEVGEDAE